MMGLSVAALITTTSSNSTRFDELIKTLPRQTYPLKDVIVVYDGVLGKEKEECLDLNLPILLLENKNRDSLTCLQNKGISLTTADAVLMLNDDIVLEDDFIEKLVLAMESDEEIGIVCGKLLRPDKQTMDTCGQFLGMDRTPLERGYGKKDCGQFDKPEIVFGTCGAAVLYRKKMLIDIALAENEYFDNCYNMFYEDLDISWRANNFGWKAYYTPKAVAYHYRGATAKAKKPVFSFFHGYNFAWLKTELKSDLIKNRYMTIIKNDTVKGFLLNFHYVLLYEIKIFFYCLVFDPLVIFETARNIPLIISVFKKRKNLLMRINKTKNLA